MPAPEARQQSSPDALAETAIVLSLTEVGLGSALHAARIPLSGQFLSLNQIFWLSRLSFRPGEPSRTAPFTASSVTALLKSLAPAGKKLTPMLAITMQGALFSIGTLLLGANAWGVGLGAALASVWAFLQPLLLYALFYGGALLSLGIFYADKVNGFLRGFDVGTEWILWAFAALVGLKIVAAVGVSLLAGKISQRATDVYAGRLIGLAEKRLSARKKDLASQKRTQSAARLAARDLFQPLFVFSFVLAALFAWASEADVATRVWILLRPIAVGFLLFWVVRRLPLERIEAWLGSRGFTRMRATLATARKVTE